MVIVGRIALPLGAWTKGCLCRWYDWQSEFSSIATGPMNELWPSSMRFRAPSETHPHTFELTPARHALRQAIARCNRARREADAAAIVVGGLNAITDEHARLQAELHELKSATSRARRAPEALWGRSTPRRRPVEPSARTVSHAWRAPARALAAVRGLRLYPYTGSSSKPGFCSGPTMETINDGARRLGDPGLPAGRRNRADQPRRS